MSSDSNNYNNSYNWKCPYCGEVKKVISLYAPKCDNCGRTMEKVN